MIKESSDVISTLHQPTKKLTRKLENNTAGLLSPSGSSRRNSIPRPANKFRVVESQMMECKWQFAGGTTKWGRKLSKGQSERTR